MRVAEFIPKILEELPDNVAKLVRRRVRFEVRPVPNAEDLERGADKDDRAYFYGFRVKAEDPDTLEPAEEIVADEGDDLGEVVGEGEVFLAAEDDDVAWVPEYKAGGAIVIFTENIRAGGKLTPAEVRSVVLHEIAHFLGEDEEGVMSLGLET